MPIRITSRFGALAPVEQTVTPEDNKIVACQFIHQYGTLVVSSDHTDAAMTIDGVDFAHPPGLPLLSPGHHKLLLRAANAPDKTRTVEVQVGYRTIIKISFSGGSPETEMEPNGQPRPCPTPGDAPRHEQRQPPVLVDDKKSKSTATLPQEEST